MEAKKAAPKRTTRKPPKAKAANNSEDTRRQLVDAPADKCFWVNFGPVIKNLRELRDALSQMSEDQFAHHVGAGRNDFAAWVGGVLDDVDCAKALRRVKSRPAALRAVESRLAVYV